MATNKETIARLDGHEKECLVRYEGIQRRLDQGNAKFDRIERMLFGIYPFILASVAIGKWL